MSNGWLLVIAQGDGSEVLGAPAGGAPAGGESTAAPGGVPGGAAPPAGQPAPGPFGMLLPLVFGLVIFMLITSMFSGRKEKKKRQQMLGELKKRDRVQTFGGIIGTIVELKGEEMVLKVDEGSNTRIRFSKAAVQQVLKSARGGGETDAVEEVELESERYEDSAGVRS